MTMLSFLRWPRQNNSADTAKERLQILLAHERGDRSGPDYLPLLQRDILEVVQKYMRVGTDDVDVRVERSNDLSMLEINIELPGGPRLQAGAA